MDYLTKWPNYKWLVKSIMWEWLYPSWGKSLKGQSTGYSVVFPMPSDLPLFLGLAVDSLLSQDRGHLVEVIVVPDRSTRAFTEYACLELLRLKKAGIHASLVDMKSKEVIVRTCARNSPGANHFLQLYTGIRWSSGTAVLFHDADLLMLKKDFLEDHYQEFKQRKVSVLGLESARKIQRSDQIRNIAATWEMVSKRDWLTQFQPHMLRGGQRCHIDGIWRSFDTTICMQRMTNENEIGVRITEDIEGTFAHVMYTISTYRIFQSHKKVEFEDKWLALIWLRLLIDAYHPHGLHYELPHFDEFILAAQGVSRRLKYSGEGIHKKISSLDRAINTIASGGAMLKQFDSDRLCSQWRGFREALVERFGTGDFEIQE